MIISVLITVHNRKFTTLACLKHLFLNQCENISLEVYLVDDGSTDGTYESVKQNYPDVHILRGNGNLYWCRGMIYAWSYAAKDNSDFFLWLNDDTMIYDTAIADMLLAYNHVGGESIVSGAISSSDGITPSYGGFVNKQIVPPNGSIQQVQMINGNFVLIPRSIYEKYGMLDSHFLHAYGDWEYGIRLRKKGVKLYLTPAYVGVCNRHDKLPKCYDVNYSISKRFVFLYSPLWPCPPSAFYYDIKCRNVGRAILNASYMHIRCIFPYFFNKEKF